MTLERLDRHTAPTTTRALFDDHADTVHAYLSRRLGDDVADDVTAEVFRVAFEQLHRYDAARGTPRAWLFGIATNLVRRHWRTERRRLDALARLDAGRTGDDTSRVDERLDAVHAVDRVLTRIADLAPEDRDLLVLVAWEGLGHRDVADALGIPIGTVGSRLHRIREQLRRGDHDA